MPDQWYVALNKPWFTPPNWLFGPAWTVLYLMIIASLVLFLRTPSKFRPRTTAALWAAHMLLNFAWTPVFFGMHAIGWALAVIIVLDLSLVVLIIMLWHTKRAASILLWPYLGWVCFATILNAAIWHLN